MKLNILFLLIFLPMYVLAEESASLDTAKQWLDIVDNGKYSESWERSDSFFQTQISKANWTAALENVRSPLGEVLSRSELAKKEYASLPGVPDGEYLVIQFKTDFQNKASSTETLTLSKSSGAWLPVGYFIN